MTVEFAVLIDDEGPRPMLVVVAVEEFEHPVPFGLGIGDDALGVQVEVHAAFSAVFAAGAGIEGDSEVWLVVAFKSKHEKTVVLGDFAVLAAEVVFVLDVISDTGLP